MAKSMRSKRMRKMRSIKRTKNAPKELKRLKKILGMSVEEDPDAKRYRFGDIRAKIKKQIINQASGGIYCPKYIVGAEAEWAEIKSVIYERKEEKKRQRPGYEEDEDDDKNEKKNKSNKDSEDRSMDVDRPDLEIDPKKLRNKHGNYPIWMNQRQVRKVKSAASGGKIPKKGKKKYAW